MRSLLVAVCLLSVASALHDIFHEVDNDFTGFQVFRISPKDEAEVEFLRSLEARPMYDFWTRGRLGGSTDIMVPPKYVLQLVAELTEQNIEYSTMISNVQDLIEQEKIPSTREQASADHPMTWDEYHPTEDMYAFVDYLEKTYDFVSSESIGTSLEGREMRVVKVCKGECGSKKAVWIDGGIHAREWISPAAVTWMLRELVENDAAHADLTESLDWYILPDANPDGYAFTRSDNRMWRKTRSTHNSIFGCKGVDANRNWGFHFNEGGASNDKCSDTYHGPEAFSEVENVNVRDFMLAHKDQLIFYNSIHSYSQLILLPWGFTNEAPEDYQQMYDTAMLGSDALTAVHGKEYEVGCIPCLLYIASGSSADWAHGVGGIKFTTSMELRDTGAYGFILPPAQIIPTSEETWAFHQAVIRQLISEL